MAVNPNNAHIRRESTVRESSEVIANDAQRLLDDPAYQRVMDEQRSALVKAIEDFQHDGSPSSDDYERELCRTLRTLNRQRRGLALEIQRHTARQLRELNDEGEK